MRSCSIGLSLFAACAAAGQSVVYSPVDATSSDFTEIPPFSGLGRLHDHSGLSVDFISGSTPWNAYNGGDPCGVTHSVLIVDEFWGSVDTATHAVHLVLDMGLETAWDRMAFFNEESAGFGTGSLRIEYGPTGTGPWSDVGWYWLTEQAGITDYGPDVLVFPTPVVARYFRLTAQPRPPEAGAATTEIAIGEILLGTAGADAPDGDCLHLEGTGIALHEDGATAVVVRTPDHAICSIAGARVGAAICTGADGRLLPVSFKDGAVIVTVPLPSLCLCRLRTDMGTVHPVRSMQ